MTAPGKDIPWCVGTGWRNLPMVPLPWERGKYSGWDPCHLLCLHRSKAVSSLAGHELAGAGHQTHKSALMKPWQGLQSVLLCSVDTEQPLVHSVTQNRRVFPSWSILTPGEHRPAGSLSCSLTAGTVYWGFALWQNSGYSWKCHCVRCGGFASTNAVVSGCLFSFWEKIWCRREGTSWKMASEGGIMASLGLSGLSVSFGESKISSYAEFALVISSSPNSQPESICFWRWLLNREGKTRT